VSADRQRVWVVASKGATSIRTPSSQFDEEFKTERGIEQSDLEQLD